MAAQDVNVVNPPGKPVPVEVVNKSNQPAPVQVMNKNNDPVPIAGSVDIGNMPTVKAQQDGAWNVNLPPGAKIEVGNVIFAPDFLQAGRRYHMERLTGSFICRVVEIQSNWVKVDQVTFDPGTGQDLPPGSWVNIFSVNVILPL